MPQTEAFARTLIDAQLEDQGWKISDGISVRYERSSCCASVRCL